VGSSRVALTENQVVDEINKYNRKGVEDDATISTITSKKLQKDNVTTDEVVKIITIIERRRISKGNEFLIKNMNPYA
jgi:hypothetical protein